MDDITKREHEEFVSGHTGCGLLQTLLHAMGPLAFMLLAAQLRSRLSLVGLKAAFLDFTFGMLSIFLVTVFAEYILYVFILIILIVLLSFAFNNLQSDTFHNNLKCNLVTARSFYHDFRGLLLLLTSLVVLAVDFPVFPRNLAKTERSGISVMDVGAGSFAFASGLFAGDHGGTLAKTLVSSLPIVIMGLLRTAAVKLSNYHEHVTEYGVHWNFFITLAIIRIAAQPLCGVPFRIAVPCLLSLAFLVCYVSLDWSEVILNDDRSNFLLANKEGIFSLPGYLLMYIYATILARLFRIWQRLTSVLIIPPICILSAFLSLSVYIFTPDEPSRRTCNLTFVAVVTFLCSTVLAGCTLIRCSLLFVSNCQKYLSSPLLLALSRHAMLYFIVFNVATGFVNFIITTATTDSFTAICVLIGYYLVTSGSFLLVDFVTTKKNS